MSVVKVNAESFDKALASTGKPVFVDFKAVWCGPCNMFAPVFEQFSERHPKEALCISVDIDECPSIASRYGISAVPTILTFKGGDIVNSEMGALPIEALERILRKVGD